MSPTLSLEDTQRVGSWWRRWWWCYRGYLDLLSTLAGLKLGAQPSPDSIFYFLKLPKLPQQGRHRGTGGNAGAPLKQPKLRSA